MKFRSKNADPIRIPSTSGHIVIVGQEWVAVPDHMIGDAYAAGCISEEMYETIKNLDAPAEKNPEGNEGDGKVNIVELGERLGKINAAINEMIDSPEGSFTNAGLPNLNKLSEKCGFTVTKAEMLPLWEEISAERDAQEGDW